MKKKEFENKLNLKYEKEERKRIREKKLDFNKL